MKKKVYGVLACLAVSIIVTAPMAMASISAQDAEQIVLKEYPGAVIHRVDREYDDGRRVYDVDFRTDTIWDGELTIDADTGQILERKEKY